MILSSVLHLQHLFHIYKAQEKIKTVGKYEYLKASMTNIENIASFVAIQYFDFKKICVRGGNSNAN